MAQVSKDSQFDVSQEFIESGKSLKTTKKRGGPYSKDEKVKRQNEVHRLHFEYGYSARKISELMNINRNTVNGDIENWYTQIINNSNDLNPEAAIVLNIQRFDIQRSRLRESLDKTENFQQRNSIEKMIFDIDSKITHIQIKLAESVKRVNDEKINCLNKWLKDNGNDHRFMTFFDKISVSEKAHERISKIISEDKKKIRV